MRKFPPTTAWWYLQSRLGQCGRERAIAQEEIADQESGHERGERCAAREASGREVVSRQERVGGRGKHEHDDEHDAHSRRIRHSGKSGIRDVQGEEAGDQDRLEEHGDFQERLEELRKGARPDCGGDERHGVHEHQDARDHPQITEIGQGVGRTVGAKNPRVVRGIQGIGLRILV